MTHSSLDGVIYKLGWKRQFSNLWTEEEYSVLCRQGPCDGQIRHASFHTEWQKKITITEINFESEQVIGLIEGDCQ
jgi:hypothetical protein